MTFMPLMSVCKLLTITVDLLYKRCWNPSFGTLKVQQAALLLCLKPFPQSGEYSLSFKNQASHSCNSLVRMNCHSQHNLKFNNWALSEQYLLVGQILHLLTV